MADITVERKLLVLDPTRLARERGCIALGRKMAPDFATYKHPWLTAVFVTRGGRKIEVQSSFANAPRPPANSRLLKVMVDYPIDAIKDDYLKFQVQVSSLQHEIDDAFHQGCGKFARLAEGRNCRTRHHEMHA